MVKRADETRRSNPVRYCMCQETRCGFIVNNTGCSFVLLAR